MLETGTAAAAQTSSTLITAASGSRSGMAAAATSTVASISRPQPSAHPAAHVGIARRERVLISRATAICRAEPGTIRMMKADNSAASEP